MLFQRDLKIAEIRNEWMEFDEYDRKNMLTDVKKERKRSLKQKLSLLSPIGRKVPSGKVSLCASFQMWGTVLKKASLAVETALVLPLFFLGLVTMISFMDIYQLETEHLSKLCDKAKEAGMYAYVPGGGGPEEITLPDVYSYEPIGGIVKLPKVWRYNTVKVHAWTGVAYQAFQDGTETEKMVYVTESGTVCHRNLGCSYLNLSVTEASGGSVGSMRNEYGERYTACEICSRNQKPAGRVYLTKKSNRYHNLDTCSGLKRSVKMVKASQAGHLGTCSRCG